MDDNSRRLRNCILGTSAGVCAGSPESSGAFMFPRRKDVQAWDTDEGRFSTSAFLLSPAHSHDKVSIHEIMTRVPNTEFRLQTDISFLFSRFLLLSPIRGQAYFKFRPRVATELTQGLNSGKISSFFFFPVFRIPSSRQWLRGSENPWLRPSLQSSIRCLGFQASIHPKTLNPKEGKKERRKGCRWIREMQIR